MQMRRTLLLATGLCAMLASGAAAGPKVGDRAPKISAGTWWNLPDGVTRLTQADLNGQIVLVEFWATW